MIYGFLFPMRIPLVCAPFGYTAETLSLLILLRNILPKKPMAQG